MGNTAEMIPTISKVSGVISLGMAGFDLLSLGAGLVAIENIRAGDKVISTNAETFETAEKTVVETYIREVPKLVHLIINAELISTTDDHPFYVKNHGFINAGQLQVGSEVINSNGDVLVVEDIKIEFVENPVTVYNFQVEDFYTYHVGENCVLVHNAEYKTVKSKISEDSGLVREAEKAGKNQQVQKEANSN